MSEIISFPLPSGPNFTIPDVGELNWGQAVTNFLVAIPNGVPPTAGTFALTGDLSFGSSFGLISKYLKSASNNISASGFMRLANTEDITWRNNANNADLVLSVNTMDQLVYNGTVIAGATGSVAAIIGTANQIIASSPTGTVTLSTPQDIAPTSTVTFGQIIDSGLSASQLVTSSGSKQLTSISSPTLTEIGYVGGATSNLQAQIGAISSSLANYLPLAGGTMTGNIAMSGNKVTGLAHGTVSGDALATGQFFGPFQAAVQITDTTITTTTSSTLTTTNTNATITPTSASHRIKITVYGNMAVSPVAGAQVVATIFRGGNNLSPGGTSFFMARLSNPNGTAVMDSTISITFIDSPATTSPVTYGIRVGNQDNSTGVQWGRGNDGSVMILEEIA